MNQAKSASPPLQAAASPPSPNALRYHLCRGLDASEVEKSAPLKQYAVSQSISAASAAALTPNIQAIASRRQRIRLEFIDRPP